MVVGLWYFTVRTSYQFPMVTQQNKDCIFKPGLFACFLHELPDGPVRVFHNLIFKLCAVWFEIVRYHIRGMVADRKQYGKERLSFFCSSFHFTCNGGDAFYSFSLQYTLHIGYCLLFRHQVKIAVFLTVIIQCAGK